MKEWMKFDQMLKNQIKCKLTSCQNINITGKTI